MMNIPGLEVPKASAGFYHGHIVHEESNAGDLFGPIANLSPYYNLDSYYGKVRRRSEADLSGDNRLVSALLDHSVD